MRLGNVRITNTTGITKDTVVSVMNKYGVEVPMEGVYSVVINKMEPNGTITAVIKVAVDDINILLSEVEIMERAKFNAE